MTWADIETRIQPTVPALAALLDGAMAPLAQAALAKEFSQDATSPPDTVNAALDAAGDQVGTKLKEAEAQAFSQLANALGGVQSAQMESAAAAKRLDILSDLEAKAAQDRTDARAHQLEAKDWWTNPALALIVTGGFFAVIWYCLQNDAKQSAMAQTLLGVLGTAWVSIITFYFGSSVGSKEKTKLLAGQLNKNR